MSDQLGDIPAASRKKRLGTSLIDDLPQAGASDDKGYVRTGIAAGLPGGEIAARRSADGVFEFTNDAGAVRGAGAAPVGGMGGIGDGIGTFSQAEPGSAQLALDRFERANQERARKITENRRGQLGEGGGRVTVVRDSSRTPTLADMQRSRLDARLAQTEALRAKTQMGIADGLDARTISQLQQLRLGQKIQDGDLAQKRSAALNGILAGLPGLEGDARAKAEREYLLLADPQAYLAQQSKTGINQLDLEVKQLQRDKLRQELEQGIGGGLKLTEGQSKDLNYYERGNAANALLAQQGDALTARATGGRSSARGMSDALIRGLPLAGDTALANSLVSAERQQAEQSGREVLAALLRKDSGAALTREEMQIYGATFLPQPGDSDAVLNQKAEARTRALESIRSGLGTAERKAAPLANGRRQVDDSLRLDGPIRVSSREDVAALPSGTTFVGPDGITRRKP